jgi:hypothetical protein
MSAAAIAILLAVLSGAASVATIAGSGSQAIVNIEKIEVHGGAPAAPAAARRLIQMTPLGPANPSFDGK